MLKGAIQCAFLSIWRQSDIKRIGLFRSRKVAPAGSDLSIGRQYGGVCACVSLRYHSTESREIKQAGHLGHEGSLREEE